MQFSPKSSIEKSKIVCSVLGCNSNNQVNLRLRFHRVPKIGCDFFKRVNFFNNTETVDKGQEWL